jgi:3-oxoacyl-[acyl-carrier protein] reductase
MDLGLHGKVAVVTGASRGIGKAVAKALIQEGCKVAICARNAERLHSAVADLSQGKNDPERRVLGLATDVTDEVAVQKFVAAAHEAFGRIDILVNNAGTHLRGTVDTTTAEILERQLREKMFGFFSRFKLCFRSCGSKRMGGSSILSVRPHDTRIQIVSRQE